MRKFLVCDGGGTKTDFIIFNENAEILSYCQKQGSNAKFINKNIAIDTVVQGISECLLKAKAVIEDIEVLTLFIPGFEECVDELKSKVKTNKLKCYGDMDNVFYGALGKGYGIVALSGTGSFAVGVSKDNRKIVSGGWGPLIGDKGSGYHIGILLLEKITYFYDNDIKNSNLKKLCFDELGISNELEMRDIIYTPDFTREKVASLCKVVAKAAIDNNIDAIDILKEVAIELVKLVSTVNKRLGNNELPVSLIGGVSKIGKLFIDMVKEELSRECNNLIYSEPLYDPLIGAMLCVLENEVKVNIENEVVKDNLEKYKGGYIKC